METKLVNFRSERKDLAEKCETLWSFLIRSAKRCIRCDARGEVEGFDAHHIVGRGLSVKYDLENGFCLCQNCHRVLTHATRTGELDLRNWTAEKFQARYERITAKKAQLATSFDYRDEYYRLRAEVTKQGLESAWHEYCLRHPSVLTLFDEEFIS